MKESKNSNNRTRNQRYYYQTTRQISTTQFKFVKDGKNQIFQNNGANIIVTKTNGEDKTTTISKKQVVAIQNNDIKVFANIDSFTKAVQEKNISQTFSLTTEETTITGVEKQETTLLSLLNSSQTIESKEEITKEISSILSDEKQILDPEQDDQINTSLFPEFYTPELKELQSAFLAGNDELFASAFAKIEKRIQTVYKSFDMSYNKEAGDATAKIKGLQAAIRNIKEKITNKYNIPPKYIENLQAIDKSLSNILTQTYGSTATHEAALETPVETTTQE